MGILILITTLLSFTAHAEDAKPSPEPTPSPTATPSLIVLGGVSLNGKPADNCYGMVWGNAALKQDEITKLLKNKFLVDEGKSRCAIAQPTCKTKCIPLMINGRTK